MKMSFSRVLRKYERTYNVTRYPDKELVDGRVVENTPTENSVSLIVFPLRPEQLQAYEGGTYTTQDRKIYQREDTEDMKLDVDDVIYDDLYDNHYEIREKAPWLDFADFSTFIAKKVVVEND